MAERGRHSQHGRGGMSGTAAATEQEKAKKEITALLKRKAGFGVQKGSRRSVGRQRSFQHPEEKEERAHGPPRGHFSPQPWGTASCRQHLWPRSQGARHLHGHRRFPGGPAQHRVSGRARDTAHAHPASFPPNAVSPPSRSRSRGTISNTHRGLETATLGAPGRASLSFGI